MDANRTRHLCEPGNRFFDVAACHHHQVGQLVDHDENVGQRQQRFPLGGVGLLRRICGVAVELLDIADARGGELLVPFLHLLDRPSKRIHRLFGVDDDRRHQMRDVLVDAKLDPLWDRS